MRALLGRIQMREENRTCANNLTYFATMSTALPADFEWRKGRLVLSFHLHSLPHITQNIRPFWNASHRKTTQSMYPRVVLSSRVISSVSSSESLDWDTIRNALKYQIEKVDLVVFFALVVFLIVGVEYFGISARNKTIARATSIRSTNVARWRVKTTAFSSSQGSAHVPE